MPRTKNLVPLERIERSILLIQGQKVILDIDLAELYGVPTKALNQAVKRNKDRFPPDFMFRLTKKEKEEVVTICDHLEKLKFSPALPNVFTEHGTIMLASVLNSKRAIKTTLPFVRYNLIRSKKTQRSDRSPVKTWPEHRYVERSDKS